MVTVEFNTCSVVYGGWTPDELYQFAPQTDALLPAQPPLSIDPAVVERPRPSMVFAPFEALRCFWDPHRSASPSGADVLLAGAACCLQVSWKGEGGRQALPEGVTGEHSFWIRFVSTFPHRKYVVVRPPKQLATLLSALRVSFSHLLVPACSEPTIHAARGLLDFVEAHAEAVSAYLPLLYFLYEMSERSVQNFFDSVEELVRRRRLNESNLLNALRPRESSWFGLGTPRFVPQESSFSDDLTFMDAHAARLPNSFKVRFISANSRVEALERARSAAIVLRDALLEEIEAFEGTVEYLGKSTGKLFYHELAGYASDVLKREGEKGEQEEQDNFKNVYGTKRVKETIVECMYIASVLQGQIFAPMLKILVDSLRRAEHNAETEFEYFHSMLEFAKTVVRNEPFMTGSKGMHKSCPAAQNHVLLRQVSEHYGKVRQTFRAFKLHVEEEMILSENAIRQSLVLCCTHCFHAFTTFYDPFDARHYTRTVSPEGRDVSIHPLLQLFDSVKKEHTHAPTDR